MDRAHPTARADLKKLHVKLHVMGIMDELKGMERITYFCPQIYNVTFEDFD